MSKRERDTEVKAASTAPTHWLSAVESHCSDLNYVRLDVRVGSAGYKARQRWSVSPSAILNENDEIEALVIMVNGENINYIEAVEMFHDEATNYLYDINQQRAGKRQPIITRCQARLVLQSESGGEITDIYTTKGVVVLLDKDEQELAVDEDASAGVIAVALRDERRNNKRLMDLVLRGYERMDRMAESVQSGMARAVEMANATIQMKSDMVDSRIENAVKLLEAKAEERRDEAMFEVLDKVADRLFDHWDSTGTGPFGGGNANGKHPAQRLLDALDDAAWEKIATVTTIGEDIGHLRDGIAKTITDKEAGFAVIFAFAPKLQAAEDALKKALTMEQLFALDRFNKWLVKEAN